MERANKATRDRNVFPEEHFFTVPLKLYDSGLAARLSGSQFKRYLTFLRLANYNYSPEKIKVDLKELEDLDGVSARSGFEVHTKLQELGVLTVDKSTRPFGYTLWKPCIWNLPDLKVRQFHRTDRIRIKTEFASFPKKRLRPGERENTPL
jgi:hypothetical protein